MVRSPLDAKVWLVYRLTRLLLPTLDSPRSNILIVYVGTSVFSYGETDILIIDLYLIVKL